VHRHVSRTGKRSADFNRDVDALLTAWLVLRDESMIHPLTAPEDCPSPESLKQRSRFGMRELLTGMLLCSVAFACQPAVGWKAAGLMACTALSLIMGWGFIALLSAMAALIMACYEPNGVIAAVACAAALMAIAFGPLTIHKCSGQVRQTRDTDESGPSGWQR
jgi:hypothetical protein